MICKNAFESKQAASIVCSRIRCINAAAKSGEALKKDCKHCGTMYGTTENSSVFCSQLCLKLSRAADDYRKRYEERMQKKDNYKTVFEAKDKPEFTKVDHRTEQEKLIDRLLN
jgi:hypothetical protein